MHVHINNPELRRLFTVAQLLLEAERDLRQQEVSEAEVGDHPESDERNLKGENHHAEDA